MIYQYDNQQVDTIQTIIFNKLFERERERFLILRTHEHLNIKKIIDSP